MTHPRISILLLSVVIVLFIVRFCDSASSNVSFSPRGTHDGASGVSHNMGITLNGSGYLSNLMRGTKYRSGSLGELLFAPGNDETPSLLMNRSDGKTRNTMVHENATTTPPPPPLPPQPESPACVEPHCVCLNWPRVTFSHWISPQHFPTFFPNQFNAMRRPIPVAVVDLHHHVLKYWQRHTATRHRRWLSSSALTPLRPPFLLHLDSHDDMEINLSQIPINGTIDQLINVNDIGNFIPVAQFLHFISMDNNVWLYNQWDLHSMVYDGNHSATLTSFFHNNVMHLDYTPLLKRDPLLRREHKDNARRINKGPISVLVHSLFNTNFTHSLREGVFQNQPYYLDVDLDFFAVNECDLFHVIDMYDRELRSFFETLRVLTSSDLVCAPSYKMQDLLTELAQATFGSIDPELLGSADLLWCNNGFQHLNSLRITLMRIFDRIGYLGAAALMDEFAFPTVGSSLNGIYGLVPTEHTRSVVTREQMLSELDEFKKLLSVIGSPPEMVTISRSALEFTPVSHLQFLEESVLQIVRESFDHPLDIEYHDSLPRTEQIDEFYKEHLEVEQSPPLDDVQSGLSAVELMHLREKYNQIQEEIELVHEYCKKHKAEPVGILESPSEFDLFLLWREREYRLQDSHDSYDLDQDVRRQMETVRRGCKWC